MYDEIHNLQVEIEEANHEINELLKEYEKMKKYHDMWKELLYEMENDDLFIYDRMKDLEETYAI